MHRASSGRSTIEMLFSPSLTSASAAATAVGGKAVCFHMGEGWEESGVDIGAIGRALGLEPASVRLNGYLLGTRGPDHVAASVTWRSLFAFFAARGLPTGRGAGGAEADSPIVVRGRPGSPGSLTGERNLSGFECHRDCTDRSPLSGGGRTLRCKRQAASQGDSPLKRAKPSRRITSAPGERADDVVGDSVLSMKKQLRLDDEIPPAKKRKETGGADPGPHCQKTSLSAWTPNAGFALNCVKGHRKRSWEDELVIALPRKRAAGSLTRI